MSPSSRRRLVRWLCHLYSLMLLAYPSAFRREYGREMALVFRDQARDVIEHGGARALLPFMLRVSCDWLHTALRESTPMTTGRLPALRWIAALPLAILSAVESQRIVGVFVPKDFRHVSLFASIAVFLMAATFVSVGVWVAPNRKSAVARIAFGVVVFWAAVSFALGAFSMATMPVVAGGCILLGGMVAYLPWRLHLSSNAARA